MKSIFKRLSFLAALCSALFCQPSSFLYAQSYISTIVGDGTPGFGGDGGPATSAQVAGVTDMCKDRHGNLLIADQGNCRIRKVDATTNIITTIAGTGTVGPDSGDGGPATAARIFSYGVAVDTFDNVYVCGINTVRKIDAVTHIITTIAGSNGVLGYSGDGGPATAALLSTPQYIVTDPSGNLYICDRVNKVIRKINTSGIITTIAGGGTGSLTSGALATSVAFSDPWNIAVDAAGAVYVSDHDANKCIKVSPSGILTVIAGNGSMVPGGSGDGGPATAASIEYPDGICTDASGNVYVAMHEDSKIRKIDGSGIITTIAGNGMPGNTGDGGPALNASLCYAIYSLRYDVAGNLLLADGYNWCVRKITLPGSTTEIANLGEVPLTDAISVYPNPTSDNVTVHTGKSTRSTITVYNTVGQCVMAVTSSDSNTIINVKNLSAGMYHINIQSDEGNKMVKLVKE